MSSFLKPEKVNIVYFSGTGCTRMAAEMLADVLRERGIATTLENICVQNPPVIRLDGAMLILLYPVYAFNAPRLVYDYIKKLEPGEKQMAVVISVSGGGEVSPNTACRARAIRMLEKKSFSVVYERMLVMPSNAIDATPVDMSVALLRALPDKLEHIAAALANGTIRRSKPVFIDAVLSVFGAMEQTGAKLMGKGIAVSPACNGCSMCWTNCPSGNITQENGRPVFGKACVTCMKCLYNCPQKALSLGFGRFLMLKEGFSLPDIQKAAARDTATSSAELPKSVAWAGVVKYLKESD